MPKKKNSPDYGKGSWKRPVDEQKYADNWNRIFGNKQQGELSETGTDTTTTK